MKIKQGDQVQVITGARKTGKVLKTLPKTNSAIVEGVNEKTKYKKKTAQGAGSMTRIPYPVDASNLKPICKVTGKPTRVGYKIDKNGKKYRIAKVSGENLDK